MSILKRIKDKIASAKQTDGMTEPSRLDTASFEGGQFAESLESFTVQDIDPNAAEKNGGHSVGWYVSRGMFALCMVVLAVCAAQMVYMIYGYQKADDIYSGIAGEFHSALSDEEHAVAVLQASDPSEPTMDYSTALQNAVNGSDISADVEYNVQFELLRANLLNLKRKNPDLYGWIRIDGTKIDYPIMQGTDNEYYLSHAYTGDFVPAGAIFADCGNSRSLLDNHNLVLYGHNMSNGAMFNNVGKYMDPAFFFSHPYVVVTTLDGVFTYEVFAVYQTTMDYKYIQIYFENHEIFVKWATEMEQNSVNHREGMKFDIYDRVLTLSTCTPSGGFWRNRYTLQAKLIKVEHGLSE